MESSTRTIDIGPTDTRPGLALILAILAVPGSTMAWELPAGGFWIGMPLAIAAILVGLKARRAPGGSVMATVAIVIAALMIAMTVVWTIVGAVS